MVYSVVRLSKQQKKRWRDIHDDPFANRKHHHHHRRHRLRTNAQNCVLTVANAEATFQLFTTSTVA